MRFARITSRHVLSSERAQVHSLATTGPSRVLATTAAPSSDTDSFCEPNSTFMAFADGAARGNFTSTSMRSGVSRHSHLSGVSPSILPPVGQYVCRSGSLSSGTTSSNRSSSMSSSSAFSSTVSSRASPLSLLSAASSSSLLSTSSSSSSTRSAPNTSTPAAQSLTFNSSSSNTTCACAGTCGSAPSPKAQSGPARISTRSWGAIVATQASQARVASPDPPPSVNSNVLFGCSAPILSPRHHQLPCFSASQAVQRTLHSAPGGGFGPPRGGVSRRTQHAPLPFERSSQPCGAALGAVMRFLGVWWKAWAACVAQRSAAAAALALIAHTAAKSCRFSLQLL
ncbi:unnamed protein product [Pelagomonas calceolata]|uniref:Uncharacterized protein n=1 Tax=Pelagomonas calceolata TaxID=35677 RepID=A0A8J2SLA0_9STRA|nr:unnamed protein product [Pelagomonas calceolata]|mmetsp:Transcript_25624/g.77937  ORF Transcript_25624/g.77937 Transcript_25624/m.77937 type:complete len:340 (-) Transcript_25624:91-1110(-)